MRQRLLVALFLVLAACGKDSVGPGDGGHGDGGLGDGGSNQPLVIAPLAPTITATTAAPNPTQAFTATQGGASVAAMWTAAPATLGSINATTGVYTASGTSAGQGTITASFGGKTATTTITVKLDSSQNGDPAYPGGTPGPGGYGGVGGDGPGAPVSDTLKATLDGAAAADATVKLLYPYDGTVWPKGLLAPLLQWESGSHSFDAVKVTLVENSYTYTGYFGKPASVTGKFKNVPIPQKAWDDLSNANVGEAVTVSLVFAEGTNAVGPIVLSWKIAGASLKGTVYYNSYGTNLVANSGEPSCGNGDTGCGTKSNRHGPDFGGATLAIQPGKTDPVLVAGTSSTNNSGCRVCHTVSANGARLLTQHGADYDKTSLYELTMSNTESTLTGSSRAFPAMYPDGSWFFSSSGGIINGDSSSRGYGLPGGAGLPMQPSGLPNNFQAALPAFSPDGKHLAFNYFGGTTDADGKSLGLLDFDLATVAFSGLKKLFTPMAPNDGVVVWPSFLPTSGAVIFELETKTNEWGFTRYGNQGHLWMYDLVGQQAVPLAKLNGDGYLPTLDATGHTAAVEPFVNYEPTVNPIASGGYAWVVFTSRRLYGNVATIDPWHSDPREYHWQKEITTKKLWVAAIDLNAPAGTDPSHPAFYLPAQELFAGNMRGFWALDPCRPDGEACNAGSDCCGGYCDQIDPTTSMCTSTPPVCAKEFEKCKTAEDCCDKAAGIECINELCTYGSPPIP